MYNSCSVAKTDWDVEERIQGQHSTPVNTRFDGADWRVGLQHGETLIFYLIMPWEIDGTSLVVVVVAD